VANFILGTLRYSYMAFSSHTIVTWLSSVLHHLWQPCVDVPHSLRHLKWP